MRQRLRQRERSLVLGDRTTNRETPAEVAVKEEAVTVAAMVVVGEVADCQVEVRAVARAVEV